MGSISICACSHSKDTIHHASIILECTISSWAARFSLKRKRKEGGCIAKGGPPHAHTTSQDGPMVTLNKSMIVDAAKYRPVCRAPRPRVACPSC